MSEIHDDGMKLVINGKQQDLSDLGEAAYILWIVPAEFSFDVMEYRSIIPNRLLFDNIHAQSVTVRPDNGIINTLFANNLKYKGQSADGPIVAGLWPLEKADNARWIEKIIDPDMHICNIALPGTHDSAAINKAIHTPYACQDRSIEEQLNGGIRLLDIRIKVDEERDGSFRFVTCHSDKGSFLTINEYEPLRSVLATCREFLSKNKHEFIVMSLKFDDLSRIDDEVIKSDLILDDLYTMLNSELPDWKIFRNYIVQDVYGKVVVINRLNRKGFDVDRFGEPWLIDHNTSTNLTISNQRIYFQDYCEFPDEGSNESKRDKLSRIDESFTHSHGCDLIVNYCSFVFGWGIRTNYANTDVRNMLLKLRKKNSLKRYGWFFIDYAFRHTDDDELYSKTFNGMRNRESLVDIIIDLNRAYHFYPLEHTDLVYERTNYFNEDL